MNETKQAWRRMLGRSLTPGYDGYNGASLDSRWLAYDVFLADMGPRPSKAHGLARLDRSRPFGPGNVEWREPGIVFCGVRRTVEEWADRLGFDRATLYARLQKKWPLDRAFCKPLRGPRPGKHGQSIWALRVNGEADGVTYQDRLSSNYANIESALEIWRGLVSRCLAEGFKCRVELLRRAPTDMDWVEIVSFSR